MWQHRYQANNNPKTVHKYILDNGGWDAYIISITEECGEIDMASLRIRERYWYETLKPICNVVIPHRTKEETLEMGRANAKARYDINRDIINELNKARYHERKRPALPVN